MHAMMHGVRHVTELPITSGTIAKAEGIPPGYVSKVRQQLVKAGFLRSIRGQERWYVFAKPREEISLLQLVETIEGQSMFGDCPLRHRACDGILTCEKAGCSMQDSWEDGPMPYEGAFNG